MKKKITIVVIIFVVIAAYLGYLAIGNPIVAYHNYELKKAVTSIGDEGSVTLNDVVPFEWDTVYTFSPYMPKANIEEIVGFKSTSIKENMINEGMVHLLFVKDKKVMASILGYPDNLGYDIKFLDSVTYDEKAVFKVTKSEEVISLTEQ